MSKKEKQAKKKENGLDSKIPSDNSAPDMKDIPVEVKEKLEKIKKKVELLKKKLLKQYDEHLIALALLPPPKQEQNLPQDKVYILVVFDDTDAKSDLYELKSKLSVNVEKISKEIDEALAVNTMLLSEVKQNLFDSKYELLELIAMSAPIYDPKDWLAGLKVSEIHKSMVLKKFDRYIVSYIAAGSLFRGEKSNDIDVFVIVDDTDVKKMTRYELREKLRAIIVALSFQAAEMAQVKKQFHVQVHILTDFWDGIKDANPVFFTLLRDGVPLFDRGVFVPWRLLLQMGKIRPSRESIDMFMSAGEKMIERVRYKLNNIVVEDLFYSTLSPAQAALMMYGVSPPTPKETVRLLDEIFVKKEKILEKKYVDILDNIRQYYKDIEHGKLKEINGNQVESLIQDSQKYLDRIKKLFEVIQKRKEQENVIELYNSCTNLLVDVLKVSGKKNKKLEAGLKDLIKERELPEWTLKTLKEIENAKKNHKKISKHEFEKVSKNVRALMNIFITLIEKRQTKIIEKVRIKLKHAGKTGEVLLLGEVAYIVPDLNKKSEVLKTEIKNNRLINMVKSNSEGLEKALKEFKSTDNVFIKETIFEDLRKILGNDVEFMISA